MINKAAQKALDTFRVGSVVADRFEILAHLGHGGMGLVVKAQDNKPNSEYPIVALKILYPHLALAQATVKRFQLELQLTKKLDHPNIVKVLEFGAIDDTTQFFTMEFVDGESLETKLKRLEPAGLPFDEIVKILSQVGAGLECAHQHGVVHRDIKPGNILVNKEGVAKITDFGVARAMDSTEKLTRTNEVLGSYKYMPPEQLSASKIDHRVDIYALGITAYELATGQMPFGNMDYFALYRMKQDTDIPLLTNIIPPLPSWFQEFIMTAAAGDSADRFQSAAQMTKFIEKHANSNNEEGVGASLINFEALRDFTTSSRLTASFAILLVFAIVAAGGYAVFNYLGFLTTP